MYHPNLYSMWLDAHNRDALPPEWNLAMNFLTWATANGYKVEFGYQGEFCPESCLAAIPHEDDELKGHLDAAKLAKSMKLDDLRKMAIDMGVDVGDAKTRLEIATLIAAVEVTLPPEGEDDPPEGDGEGEDDPPEKEGNENDE